MQEMYKQKYYILREYINRLFKVSSLIPMHIKGVDCTSRVNMGNVRYESLRGDRDGVRS